MKSFIWGVLVAVIIAQPATAHPFTEFIKNIEGSWFASGEDVQTSLLGENGQWKEIRDAVVTYDFEVLNDREVTSHEHHCGSFPESGEGCSFGEGQWLFDGSQYFQGWGEKELKVQEITDKTFAYEVAWELSNGGVRTFKIRWELKANEELIRQSQVDDNGTLIQKSFEKFTRVAGEKHEH